MADLCPVAVGGGDRADENQPETAGESYLQALKEMKLCDVVFTFEKCDDRIEAHQLFLRLRSPVFFAMFRGQSANVGKTREVQVSGVSPQRFQEFLEFMYADKFEVNIAGALDLLHLGHKYKVNPLIKKCEQLLKTEIRVEDAVQLFETARKYQHEDLEQQAADVMAKNLEEILKTDGLLGVQEEMLVYLLQRDDLTVEELELFRLIVKWGENKLKNAPEPSDLRTVLANLLPLVRFTSMTPDEFSSEVVPLNLLPAQETIAVFSYLASDGLKRQNISALLKFNMKPRESENTDSLVRLYKQAATTSALAQYSGYPLKEGLSFCPSYEVPPKLWDNYSSRRPAITGILISWPMRDPSHIYSYNDRPKFKVSVKWSAAAISDQSVGQKFVKAIPDCAVGQETEISVEPPVELISGTNYCITVEDLSNHFYTNIGGYMKYCYSQNTAASGVLNATLCVPLKKLYLELKALQRNYALSGFGNANYANIRIIQGVRIRLV